MQRQSNQANKDFIRHQQEQMRQNKQELTVEANHGQRSGRDSDRHRNQARAADRADKLWEIQQSLTQRWYNELSIPEGAKKRSSNVGNTLEIDTREPHGGLQQRAENAPPSSPRAHGRRPVEKATLAPLPLSPLVKKYM